MASIDGRLWILEVKRNNFSWRLNFVSVRYDSSSKNLWKFILNLYVDTARCLYDVVRIECK